MKLPARLSEPVRVGVVGLGRFGRLHALTLQSLSEAQLVALVARRPESLAAVAHDLPGVPGWTSLQQALAESDAEAWVVACTTADHVHVTRQLLEAGKKVLLEKPISDSLEEALELTPLVQPDSGNLMVGHLVLFNTEFQHLLYEVRQRGPISFLQCVRHRPASIVRQFAGEHPLHAVMVHDLYSAQVMLNRAEPNRFSARCHRTCDGAIDLALAELGWPGGTVASFAASYLTPEGMPPRGFDRTEVFGVGWSARIEPNPRPIQVWDTQARWPQALEIHATATVAAGMMAEELRCFCRVVRWRQQAPVGTTYTDAIQVQRWMKTLADCANAGE